MCSEPPAIAVPGLAQWFCGNDDCDVLCWDPYATLEDNLTDARPALITSTPSASEPEPPTTP